jgi:hypothetical protein
MRRARTVISIRKGGRLRGKLSKPCLARHDLGNVTAGDLIEEGEIAVSMFVEGVEHLKRKELDIAIDLFFKSAAVAVNVIFTARTHKIAVPAKVINTMQEVSAKATQGIMEVIMVVAKNKTLKHEVRMHGKKGVARAVRKLLKR